MEGHKIKSNYELIIDENSVFRGTFYGTIGILYRVLLLFLTNLILARVLGAKLYGIWSLNFVIMTIVNAIGLMGLDQGLSRFIGKYQGEEKIEKVIDTVNTGIVLVLIVSLLSSFLLFFLSSFISKLFNINDLSWMLKIISFTLIPAALVGIIGSIFQGYENIKISRIINSFVPSSFWMFAVILLLLIKKINFLNIYLAYLISTWLSAGVALIFLIQNFSQRRISISLKSVFNSVKKMLGSLLSFCTPLLLFNLLTLIREFTDTFLIGYFLGTYEVGIYQVAFRIARLVPFLFLGTRDIFTPLISKKLVKDNYNKDSINELYLRTTKWLFAPTLLIIFTIMMFPDFFLTLFGGEFLQSSSSLKLLLWAYFIYGVVGPVDSLNVALGSTKFIAGYTLLGAITSIIFNLLLIPRFGVEGAAISAFLSILLIKIISVSKLHIIDDVTLFRSRYILFVIFSTFIGFVYGFLLRRVINNVLYGVIFFIILFGLFELLILKKLHLIDEKDKILFKYSILKLNIFTKI